jgi:hypothetical protein
MNGPVWRLDILSFVRISRLNWIGHVNIRDNKKTVSPVFKNNPQEKKKKKQMVELCTNIY